MQTAQRRQVFNPMLNTYDSNQTSPRPIFMTGQLVDASLNTNGEADDLKAVEVLSGALYAAKRMG
jgi:hypothetical protein